LARKIIILIFILGIKNVQLFGQMTPIQLDRPDQTECPFIVPINYIQLENGFTYENIDTENRGFYYPSTLWKYGISKRFEFRLITEFVSEKQGNQTTTGLNPITVGFKVNICQEKGLLPITSFIGHLTSINIGSTAFHTKYIAPSFRFTMQHTLSDKISLAYNLGAKWDGETREHTFLYTLTTGIALTNKLGGYIEVYGFAPNYEQAEHRFDGGFTYLINNDFMLDLSGGLRLTENAPKNYISLGVSYRFKIKNRKLTF
jgi:hypothetical protein